MVNTYVPEAGDIVMLDFDPQVGREQAKRRPALVLSGTALLERSWRKRPAPGRAGRAINERSQRCGTPELVSDRIGGVGPAAPCAL